MRRKSFLATTGALALAGTRAFARGFPAVEMTVRNNRPLVAFTFRSAGQTQAVHGLLDTGGGVVLLGRDVDRGLHLVPDGPVRKSSQGDLAPVPSPQLYVGDEQIEIPDGRCYTRVGPDAGVFIGVSFTADVPGSLFRAHAVTFDYPGGRFELDQPFTKPEANVPVRIDPQSSFPRIEVSIAGKTYGLLVDTGATFTMMSQALIDDLRKAYPAWKWAPGAYGSANMFGGKEEAGGEMLQIPQVEFAGVTFDNVSVVSRPAGTYETWMSKMMSAPIVGSLGGNVLRNLALRLDYPNETLSFTRADVAFANELNIVPVTLTPHPDGAFEIASVLPAGKFSVPNDRVIGRALLAVDGTAVAGKSLYDVQQMLRGAPNSAHRLTLADGKSTVEVQGTVTAIF